MDKSESIMVKFIIIILLNVTLWADVYSKNCVACHKEMPVKIDKFFYRYLLKYSSEENLKSALISYLKNPTKDTTILQRRTFKPFWCKRKNNFNY